MSMSPSALLAKLDELKKWQKEQQERLLKQHYSQLEETEHRTTLPSDYDTIQGLSAFDSIHQDDAEQKTQEAPPVENITDAKPKRPFLKRGAGLTKFGMKPGDQKKPVNKMTVPKTAVHKRLAELRKAERKLSSQDVTNDNSTKPNTVVTISRFTLDPSQPEVQGGVVSVTPLRMPDVAIKAKWTPPNPSNESDSKVPTSVISKINDMASQIVEDPQTPPRTSGLNPDLLECLQKLAADKFGNSQNKNESLHILHEMSSRLGCNDSDLNNPDVNKQLIEYLQQLAKHMNESSLNSSQATLSATGDTTAYERALEQELRIFEQLEQKVMNSSFCSTNSSVLELLSSTPQKGPRAKFQDAHEKKAVHFDAVQQENKAKRELDYNEEQERSLESSVDSEDFEEKTLGPEVTSTNFASRDGDISETTSCSSTMSLQVIVKQNACVQTDDLEFNETKLTDEEEILKRKLKELDKEITNFRTENTKLQKMKNELGKETRELDKYKRKLDREMEEERVKLEFEIEEERKKLHKEKMVFERYAKDLQNRPSKKEREEISDLKIELANVKETLKMKETRNGTCQARLRNQIKHLEKDNNNLREEVEKLQKQNAKLTAAQKVLRKPSEAKMLHEINKNISKLAKDTKVNQQVNKAEKSIEKLNNLDESLVLLQEKNKKLQNSRRKSNDKRKDYSVDSEEASSNEEEENEGLASEYVKSYTQALLRPSLRKSKSKSESLDEDGTTSPMPAKSTSDFSSTAYTLEKENDRNMTNFDTTAFRNLSGLNLENNYEEVFGRKHEKKRNDSLNDTQSCKSDRIETILSDGSKETKYSNGNIKVTSADGNFIKMNYSNGDIKEMKLLDGSIKYYYAESQLWQTSFADGNEVLEYPDGIIEKRYTDGGNEIVCPNGFIKYSATDGSERIEYPDGSIVQINKGEKVLLLPNGQKEIHTSKHKRREYPDGTVKMLYPDGLQETRYSNGRIRMKDKDGNLLMDTHSDM